MAQKDRGVLDVFGGAIADLGTTFVDAGTEAATSHMLDYLTGEPSGDRDELHPTGDQQPAETVQTGATPEQMLWFAGAAALALAGVAVLVSWLWR